jgi:tetratricopeptide (TPR) repeat protein
MYIHTMHIRYVPLFGDRYERERRYEEVENALKRYPGDLYLDADIGICFNPENVVWERVLDLEEVVLAANNNPQTTLLHLAACCNKTWLITQLLKDPVYNVGAKTALQVAIKFNALGRFSGAARLLNTYIEENKVKYQGGLAKAYRMDQENAVAHSNKGCTFHERGQYQEALVCFNVALRSNAGYVAAHYGKGDTLRMLNQDQEALVSLNETLRLDPKHVFAHYSKGEALYSLGQYQEAIASYNEAIRLDPEFSSAHIGKGNVLYALCRYEEALISYNEALRLDPNDAYVHNNKGHLLLFLGDLNGALACYEKSLGLEKKDSYAQKMGLTGKGNVFLQLKRYQEAAESFTLALALNFAKREIDRCNEIKKVNPAFLMPEEGKIVCLAKLASPSSPSILSSDSEHPAESGGYEELLLAAEAQRAQAEKEVVNQAAKVSVEITQHETMSLDSPYAFPAIPPAAFSIPPSWPPYTPSWPPYTPPLALEVPPSEQPSKNLSSENSALSSIATPLPKPENTKPQPTTTSPSSPITPPPLKAASKQTQQTKIQPLGKSDATSPPKEEKAKTGSLTNLTSALSRWNAHPLELEAELPKAEQAKIQPPSSATAISSDITSTPPSHALQLDPILVTQTAELHAALQPGITISAETLIKLTKEVSALKQKVMQQELPAGSEYLLQQLLENGTHVSLLRLGQHLRQREKELNFFKSSPTLWETFLTLAGFLTIQLTTAKVIASKLTDMKTKPWIKGASVAITAANGLVSTIDHLSKTLHLPIISGVANGLVQAYGAYTDGQRRKEYEPLSWYAPTLEQQDDLVQQLVFACIERFHEMLLLAESLENEDLADAVSKTLNLPELKQKFNELFDIENTDSVIKLGNVFGKYFGNKLIEIILSEPPNEALLDQALKTGYWQPIIQAWLASSIWTKAAIKLTDSVELNVDDTLISQLMQVDEAVIRWGHPNFLFKQTIFDAMCRSDIKTYIGGQWLYTQTKEKCSMQMGYIYEPNPGKVMGVKKPARLDPANATKLTAITDAQNHYHPSAPIAAAAVSPAPVNNPSPPSSAVIVLTSLSVKSHSSASNTSFSSSDWHPLSEVSSGSSIASDAEKDELRRELERSRREQAEIKTDLEQLKKALGDKANAAEVKQMGLRIDQFSSDYVVGSGSEMVLAQRDFDEETPKYKFVKVGTQKAIEQSDAALNAIAIHEDRIHQLENQLEVALEEIARMKRANQRSSVSFFSQFQSTTNDAEPSVPFAQRPIAALPVERPR